LVASFVWAEERPAPQSRLETEHDEKIARLAFSGDGKVLAAVADDNSIKVLDLAMKGELASAAGVSGVFALSHDGTLLAFASGDPEKEEGVEVKIWNTAQGKQQSAIEHLPGAVLSMAFTPNGKSLALGLSWKDDKHNVVSVVKLFDAATGEERAKFGDRICADNIPGTIAVYGTALAFSLDGAQLAVGALSGGDATGDVTFWDVREGKQIGSGTAANLWAPQTMIFSPDGKSVAAIGEHSVLWKFPSGEELWQQPKSQGMTSAAFGIDGKSVLEAGSVGVFQYDAATGKPLASDTRALQAAALSPDGRRLAVAEGTAILLFDMEGYFAESQPERE
jgi:WD40 repeat protein